ncbi:MAG: hypothetical protein AAF569_04975 [Pseudomonadota bacterium]
MASPITPMPYPPMILPLRGEIRDALYECDVRTLTKCALAPDASILVKAFTLQRLKRYSIDDAANVLEQSGVSPIIINSCIVSSSKTFDPLALYLPLIMDEYYTEKGLSFELPVTLKCRDVPLYAADPLHNHPLSEVINIEFQQLVC